MGGNFSGHCRSYAKAAMQATEVVVSEMKGNSRPERREPLPDPVSLRWPYVNRIKAESGPMWAYSVVVCRGETLDRKGIFMWNKRYERSGGRQQ